MPGLFTHYLCGEEALKLVKDNQIEDLVSKHRQVFNLGTQGPDIFFFYIRWPWRSNRGMKNLGKIMHNKNVGKFFASALKYVKTKAGADADVLTAYLYGFACHYSMDAAAHPYVFYKTGFVRKGEAHTWKYSCMHSRFETAVDVLMLQHKAGIGPYDLKAQNLIRISGSEAQAVGRMYSAVLREVYGVRITWKQVRKALADMGMVFAILRDKSGMKRKLLTKLESKIGPAGLLLSIIYPASVPDEPDYLNLKQMPWAAPWDRTLVSRESFCLLFQRAAHESSEFFGIIRSYLTGAENLKHTMDRIGNRSFISGMDCNSDIIFNYYDCIYEKAV